jgi:hypothetical protein
MFIFLHWSKISKDCFSALRKNIDTQFNKNVDKRALKFKEDLISNKVTLVDENNLCLCQMASFLIAKGKSAWYQMKNKISNNHSISLARSWLYLYKSTPPLLN